VNFQKNFEICYPIICVKLSDLSYIMNFAVEVDRLTTVIVSCLSAHIILFRRLVTNPTESGGMLQNCDRNWEGSGDSCIRINVRQIQYYFIFKTAHFSYFDRM
jgi:hypothetical protein